MSYFIDYQLKRMPMNVWVIECMWFQISCPFRWSNGEARTLAYFHLIDILLGQFHYFKIHVLTTHLHTNVEKLEHQTVVCCYAFARIQTDNPYLIGLVYFRGFDNTASNCLNVIEIFVLIIALKVFLALICESTKYNYWRNGRVWHKMRQFEIQ